MKKLLIALVCVALIHLPVSAKRTAGCSGTPLVCTDDFTRANSATLGGNWTNGGIGFGCDIGVTSNAAAPQSAGGPCATYAYWSANSFSGKDDQGAYATITTIEGGAGPATRMSGTTTAMSGYYLTCATGDTLRFQKVTTGTRAQIIDTGVSCANGDVEKLESIGTAHHVYRNGTEVGGSPFTDSSFASGQPGMFMVNFSTAQAANLWSGYEIGGAAPTFPAARILGIVCCQRHAF